MAAMTLATSSLRFRLFSRPFRRCAAATTALVLALSLASAACGAPIDSVKAPFHVGESVMVCGEVAKVTVQKKRTLLNLGAPYPREHVSVLVWKSDLPALEKKFGRLASLEKQRVCAQGEIESYKDHLFLPVKNPTLLRLMK